MSLSTQRQIAVCFLVATTALAVAMGIGRFAFTPILPLMIQENLVKLPQTAWLSSSNYVGYLVGALSLLKNTRHRLFVVLGLSLVTMTTWLAASVDFWWLLGLRFLAGMASAWVLVSVSAWAITWLKAKQVAKNGLIYTGVGIGITLTGLLCGGAILHYQQAVATSFQLSGLLWRYLGGIALFATLVVAGFIRLIVPISVTQPVEQKSDSNTQRHLTQNPAQSGQQLRLLNILLAYGLFGFGYILPATFLPQIAKQWLTGSQYLLIWPFFGLAAALSVAVSQWLQRRFATLSLLRLWMIAQCLMAVGTLLPAIWQSLMGLMLSAVLVGGTFMVVTMAGLQVAASQIRFYPNYNLSALMTASFAFGQLIGPLTALIATGQNIWLMLLPISAIVLMIGVVLLWRPYQLN